jgi:hypothetical protein
MLITYDDKIALRMSRKSLESLPHLLLIKLVPLDSGEVEEHSNREQLVIRALHMKLNELILKVVLVAEVVVHLHRHPFLLTSHPTHHLCIHLTLPLSKLPHTCLAN